MTTSVPVPRETLAKAANEKDLVLGISAGERSGFRTIPSAEKASPIDVGVVEELGADAFIYGTLSGIAEDELITAQQIIARIHASRPPARGESVRLLVDADARACLLQGRPRIASLLQRTGTFA